MGGIPLASVDGLYQDIPYDKQDLTGTELRFNPFNTMLFETLDGTPVRSVEEATIYGTRVFARGKIDIIDKKQGVIWQALSTTMRYADPLGQKNKKSKTITPEEQKIQNEWDAVYKEMRENGGRITFYGRNDFESQVAELRKLSKQYVGFRNAFKNLHMPICVAYQNSSYNLLVPVGNLIRGMLFRNYIKTLGFFPHCPLGPTDSPGCYPS